MKSRTVLAHSDGMGSPRLGAERTFSLERFPAIVKLCPPFVWWLVNRRGGHRGHRGASALGGAS